jgi:hypothetical protein
MAEMVVDVQLSKEEIEKLSRKVAKACRTKLDTKKRKRLKVVLGKLKFSTANFVP